MNCCTCKFRFDHGGECYENKSNCLHYIEDERGYVLRQRMNLLYNAMAETPIITKGSIIKDEGGKEIKVIRIYMVNMRDGIIDIEGEFFSNNTPRNIYKSMFKIKK